MGGDAGGKSRQFACGFACRSHRPDADHARHLVDAERAAWPWFRPVRCACEHPWRCGLSARHVGSVSQCQLDAGGLQCGDQAVPMTMLPVVAVFRQKPSTTSPRSRQVLEWPASLRLLPCHLPMLIPGVRLHCSHRAAMEKRAAMTVLPMCSHSAPSLRRRRPLCRHRTPRRTPCLSRFHREIRDGLHQRISDGSGVVSERYGGEACV
jgi:hypothetical protein